jgi:hypothetical protein
LARPPGNRVALALFPALVLVTARAGAEPVAPKAREVDDCAESPSAARRGLAVAAALVPGVVVHGTGHWVLCRPRTARKLLLYEGIGFGTLVGSLGGLALTGASPHTVGPFALGAIGGVGLFGVTFLADLYGVVAPEGGTGGPETRRLRLTLWTGVRRVEDRLFPHDWFGSQRLVWDVGLVSITPSFDFALDVRNQRYALEVAHRLSGKTARREAENGSFLDVALGASDHAYADEGFGFTTLELRADARLDLEAFDRNLTGSFAESSAGVARQWLRYDGFAGDTTNELLARIGFGMYLGWPGSVHGETKILYDHRRDTLSGGLRFPGVPAGYAGHLEQWTEVFFGSGYGAALEVQYGSAWVLGAYMLFRPGESP